MGLEVIDERKNNSAWQFNSSYDIHYKYTALPSHNI